MAIKPLNSPVGKTVTVNQNGQKLTGTVKKSSFGDLVVELQDGREIKCKLTDVVENLPEVEPVYAETRLPAAYTDEGLQSKIAEAPQPSGVYVLSDEWDGQVDAEGSNVFGDAARPWQEANPDKEFRFLSDTTIKRRGTRGYVPVHDANGTAVKVGGMTLGRIPKDVYNQRRAAVEQKNRENLVANAEKTQEVFDQTMRDNRGIVAPLNANGEHGSGLTPYGTRRG